MLNRSEKLIDNEIFGLATKIVIQGFRCNVILSICPKTRKRRSFKHTERYIYGLI